MVANIAPGTTTWPNTRWSLTHAGSEAKTSVSNATSPRGDSCRTPSNGWPALGRRRFGASIQWRRCWNG